MKEYTNLEIEVIKFKKADVVVASGEEVEHDNSFIDFGDFM